MDIFTYEILSSNTTAVRYTSNRFVHVGHQVKHKNSGFVILSNIAVTNITSDCFIREC